MLIGHSAGAHLCALTTLFLTDGREELFIEASKQRDITLAVKGVIGKDNQVYVDMTFDNITNSCSGTNKNISNTVFKKKRIVNLSFSYFHQNQC